MSMDFETRNHRHFTSKSPCDKYKKKMLHAVFNRGACRSHRLINVTFMRMIFTLLVDDALTVNDLNIAKQGARFVPSSMQGKMIRGTNRSVCNILCSFLLENVIGAITQISLYYLISKRNNLCTIFVLVPSELMAVRSVV